MILLLYFLPTEKLPLRATLKTYLREERDSGRFWSYFHRRNWTFGRLLTQSRRVHTQQGTQPFLVVVSKDFLKSLKLADSRAFSLIRSSLLSPGHYAGSCSKPSSEQGRAVSSSEVAGFDSAASEGPGERQRRGTHEGTGLATRHGCFS